MISGAHVMIFTRDEDADRAFLRDVVGIPCIDGGGGWLIFKLPPTEMGVHGGELHLDEGPGKIRSSYRASSSTITRGSAPATEPTSAPRSRIS